MMAFGSECANNAWNRSRNHLRQYVFGPLSLLPTQKILFHGTEHVHLAPKVFDVLLVLVRHADQVVSRDTIRRDVWHSDYLEESVISRTVSLLRAGLRPHLEGADPIQTLSKRGYRFLIPVTSVAPPWDGVERRSRNSA
jgi:DNA-binding winged helix-turn-helix (wHTH) protein